MPKPKCIKEIMADNDWKHAMDGKKDALQLFKLQGLVELLACKQGLKCY